MNNFAIHNPHDRFFKHSLSNLTVAKDFLKAHLNPETAERIQWETLCLTNKSYTDEKFKHLYSDLIYTCQINGKDVYISILLEHQPTPDPLLPFRILQSNAVLLTDYLAESKQGPNTRLPIILNLCLYLSQGTP
jgi:predicted transposase/invertase (TIGR01784 family)